MKEKINNFHFIKIKIYCSVKNCQNIKEQVTGLEKIFANYVSDKQEVGKFE